MASDRGRFRNRLIGHRIQNKADFAKAAVCALLSAQTGLIVSATYQVRATFARAPAIIRVSLIRHAGRWPILSFGVYSVPGFEPLPSPGKSVRAPVLFKGGGFTRVTALGASHSRDRRATA